MRKKKMSGTVNYGKVVNELTDVIKEMNVRCGAAASEERGRADAVGVVKALLHVLEQGTCAAGAAAAEHGAGAEQQGWDWALRSSTTAALRGGGTRGGFTPHDLTQ